MAVDGPGWFNTQVAENEAHVHPEKDLAVHALDLTCWCVPRAQPERGGRIVIHNSLDGRERNEANAQPRMAS